MSIRVTLNCQVKPGQLDELIPFLEDNLPNVRGFHGNKRVSVLFDYENSEMLLDEEWVSVDTHQAYLSFIEKNGVLNKLSSFLSSPPRTRYFTEMEI